MSVIHSMCVVINRAQSAVWVWHALIPKFMLDRVGFQSHMFVFVSYNYTSRPRQNRRHFADDTFKCIFLNGNFWILIKISLKCVPKSFINTFPALVQIMAWRRPVDKPLSESMMVRSLTHLCAIRLQWVNVTHSGAIPALFGPLWENSWWDCFIANVMATNWVIVFRSRPPFEISKYRNEIFRQISESGYDSP